MRLRTIRFPALISMATGLACATGELPGADSSITSVGQATSGATLGGATDGADGGHADTERDDDAGDAGADGETPDPSCNDGEQNQGETDVDCGGPNCPPCEAGQACSMDSDCETESCVGSVCITPSCTDGVHNGSETDVDCGGPTCNGCTEGKTCGGDSDCLSQHCPDGTCAAADCLVDADCSAFSGQCTVGSCDDVTKTCSALAANEGNTCDDGDLCTTGDTCVAGACSSGAAVDCTNLNGACQVGVCNANDGQCVVQSANEGNACNDGNPCTVASVCTLGQCQDPNAPGYVFHDTFANNGAGWTLGPNWGIGPTSSSSCSSCPGNDPALDHTPTADNGVAGVVLGGCTPTHTHGDYCLTSPAINTAGLPSVWLTYWRHLHADYSPYMTSKVEVFNGTSWQQIWSTGASCTNDPNWYEMAHNVTAHSNASFRVRFCYSIGSAGVFASGGWSIDDLTIGPAQCTPSP
jgi:hypothetical protein